MPKKKLTQDKRKQHHLAFGNNTLKKLEDLIQVTDSTSVTESIRRSIALHHGLTKAMAEGAKLILRYPNGVEREVLWIE